MSDYKLEYKPIAEGRPEVITFGDLKTGEIFCWHGCQLAGFGFWRMKVSEDRTVGLKSGYLNSPYADGDLVYPIRAQISTLED